MRRIVPFFALLALAAAAAPAAGQGTMRMSTVVDNMVGEAGDTPEARLLFSRDDEEELCVIIAIPTGPTALRAPLFRFALRVEGADRSEPLKFPLPKKPEQPTDDKRLRVWEGCLPVAVDTGEAGAVIDVTYHDPRLLKERAELNTEKEQEDLFEDLQTNDRPVFAKTPYNDEVVNIALDYLELLGDARLAQR